jgi:hypothetical protein
VERGDQRGLPGRGCRRRRPHGDRLHRHEVGDEPSRLAPARTVGADSGGAQICRRAGDGPTSGRVFSRSGGFASGWRASRSASFQGCGSSSAIWIQRLALTVTKVSGPSCGKHVQTGSVRAHVSAAAGARQPSSSHSVGAHPGGSGNRSARLPVAPSASGTPSSFSAAISNPGPGLPSDPGSSIWFSAVGFRR